MKRFAVFAYDQYYPSGGMCDFKKSFDTEDEAHTYAEDLREHWDNVEVEDLELDDSYFVFS